MNTHRSTCKRRERHAARLFGAERQPGSGSCGDPDRSCSDSTHDRLYIETKLRANSSVRTLREKTAALAHCEGKTPLLMLYSKGRVGGLIVCHEMHLAAVAAELKTAPGVDPRPLPRNEGADEPFLPGFGDGVVRHGRHCSG
jgi:hypothetical protein